MAEAEGRELWRLLGVGMVVCCGIPLLGVAGVGASLAGVGLGNWILLAVGLLVVASVVTIRARRSGGGPGSTGEGDDDCRAPQATASGDVHGPDRP